MCNLNNVIINELIGCLLSSNWMVRLCFWAVRFRQEEKRQLEECSKVKERKRKRDKYAERVSFLIEAQGIDFRIDFSFAVVFNNNNKYCIFAKRFSCGKEYSCALYHCIIVY